MHGRAMGMAILAGLLGGAVAAQEPEHDCGTRVHGTRPSPGGRIAWDQDWAQRLATVRACAAEGCAWTPVMVFITSDH